MESPLRTIRATAFLVHACLLACLACSARKMPVSHLTGPPRSVVSLSPSITAELMNLESAHIIAGVTTYHPPLKNKPVVVGSLINPSAEIILALAPDCVMLSEEDAIVQNAAMLDRLGIMTEVFPRNDSFAAITDNYRRLARIVGKEALAERRLEAYRISLATVNRPAGRPSVALFVSFSPLVTVSDRSFLGAVIADAGGRNVYGKISNPYPPVSMETLVSRDPDSVIIMKDGSEKDFISALSRYTSMKAVRDKRIYTVTPDDVAHYTPASYVHSVRLVAGLIGNPGGGPR